MNTEAWWECCRIRYPYTVYRCAKCGRGPTMCTTCTIAALRFELTKAQEKIGEYRKALVQIEAKGLGATATAGYICSRIAETALKQGEESQ